MYKTSINRRIKKTTKHLLEAGFLFAFVLLFVHVDSYCSSWGQKEGKGLYESFATVGEIRVWWRADFQSGSRVLKKVF